MTAIWKYPIEAVRQSVPMPEGAQILAAQMQGETLCVWAAVNPKASTRPRVIEVIPTGEVVEDACRRYVSTVQMLGGSLVYHVFEVFPKEEATR